MSQRISNDADYPPKELVVLVGGLGTRLRSAVPNLPKPMAPVRGEPLLAHLLRYWISQGIEHFVLATGYMGDVINDYFGDSIEGRLISYSHESSPLGTGGAVFQALEKLKLPGKYIALANGDTWFNADLHKLYEDAQARDACVTMIVKKSIDSGRYGSVVLNQSGLISSFGQHSKTSTYINIGSYLLNVPLLNKNFKNPGNKFSFEEECLKKLAVDGLLAGSIQSGEFLDIGIPEDYALAEGYIK